LMTPILFVGAAEFWNADGWSCHEGSAIGHCGATQSLRYAARRGRDASIAVSRMIEDSDVPILAREFDPGKANKDE
jgi:hypothetical protein